ncbi:TRAP transporter large permease subunit, partial [Lysinibacillus sp. D4A3_S15]|uniref:TRAP transporter large permease subunit n=1 Tax=Lysinibacillus sp. D4A3_S15 TaxID=2941227 RepID=UPI0020BD4880
REQDLESIVNLRYFTTDGIFGTPISVSATFIFVFLLFGAFLVKTGVGQYFNDLAVSFAGKLIGGPAIVAVFS